MISATVAKHMQPNMGPEDSRNEEFVRELEASIEHELITIYGHITLDSTPCIGGLDRTRAESPQLSDLGAESRETSGLPAIV